MKSVIRTVTRTRTTIKELMGIEIVPAGRPAGMKTVTRTLGEAGNKKANGMPSTCLVIHESLWFAP